MVVIEHCEDDCTHREASGVRGWLQQEKGQDWRMGERGRSDERKRENERGAGKSYRHDAALTIRTIKFIVG